MSNRTTETELRRLEERVYRLPVDDLERRVAALEQGVAQQSGRSPSRLCVRTWLWTMYGLQTFPHSVTQIPLVGETVAYGPSPYDALTTVQTQVTDGSGVVNFTTYDQVGSGNQFALVNPRFDQNFFGGGSGTPPPTSFMDSSVPCGGALGGGPPATNDVVCQTSGTGSYLGTCLNTPYPLKKTLAIDVPSLSLSSVPLSQSPPGSVRWTGSATANYPGGGPHGCAAVPSLAVTITFDLNGTNPILTFNYNKTGTFNCPVGSGGTSTALSFSTSVTWPVSGDGRLATALSVTVGTGGVPAGDLFPSGAPVITIYEV